MPRIDARRLLLVFDYNIRKKYMRQILLFGLPYFIFINVGLYIYTESYNEYIDMLLLTVYNYSFLWVLFTAHFAVRTLKDYKSNLLEKSYQKSIAESSAQRRLIESIHHELSSPTEILKIALKKLEYYLANGSCLYGPNSDCGIIRKYPCSAQGITPELAMLFENAASAIERIWGPIKQMEATRNVKAGNGTQSFNMLISNIASSVRYFNAGAIISVSIKDNNEMFNRYAVGRGMDNSEMLSIINNLVVNAKEAGASNIVFTPVNMSSNGKYMDIHVIDNGSGICDISGNIITDYDVIFNWGISGKDAVTVAALSTNTLVAKLFKRFNIIPEVSVIRGSGLFRCRELLRKAGGDIRVVATKKSEGTIFELRVPVKKVLR